jgi:hypothetical protein
VQVFASDPSGFGEYRGVWFQASDSKLYTGSDTAVTGATGVTVTTGVWYKIDYQLNSTADPWVLDAAVDTVALGQSTFAVAASAGAATVRVGRNTSGGTASNVWFDDFQWSVTAADYPLSAGNIRGFVPTADGTHNVAGAADFERGNTGTDIIVGTTTAWQLVDDRPLPTGTVDEADCIRAVAPPNATDYVECAWGDTGETVAPLTVEAVIAYHQIATQNGDMKVALNDNGTLSNIVNYAVRAGVVTYRYDRVHFLLPPTGGAWTAATSGAGAFNNLKFRFYSADAAPDQCLDGIMLEAEFAPVVGGQSVVPVLMRQYRQRWA